MPFNASLEKFNNKTAEKIAVDLVWYGYKEHASVDMQSGLINKIAAISVAITDAEGVAHVCPTGGAVFGDKGTV